VNDLVEFQAANEMTAAPGRPNLSDFADKVHGGLSDNTAHNYLTHFRPLLNGVARQCSCASATCVQEFRTTRTCACACMKCAKASDLPSRADSVIIPCSAALVSLDLLVKLVHRMAIKRAMAANLGRQPRSSP
jgi:hypothetical protein